MDFMYRATKRSPEPNVKTLSCGQVNQSKLDVCTKKWSISWHQYLWSRRRIILFLQPYVVYPTFYPTFYPTPSVAKPFLSDQLQFKERGFYILTFPPQQQGLLKGERKTMKINPYAARSAFKGLAWLGWRGRGKNLLGKKTRTKGGKERKLRCVKY